MYLGQTADPFYVYNRIQEIFLESQHVVTGMRVFLAALFNDEGLQGICDAAYSFLGNPVFVIDNSYKHLAVSIGSISDNTVLGKETIS